MKFQMSNKNAVLFSKYKGIIKLLITENNEGAREMEFNQLFVIN